MFGNFYCPGYDDPAFVDETMNLIRELGYNSVMFDTKDSEDFRERYRTGVCSQYVKMQEYMGKSALNHGLSYNFLVLYLNGDNLYPHIRFSPPVFGEETMTIDQKPGKWYKYWSKKAQETMAEHVEQLMQMYQDGCTVCESDGKEVVPVCSMWDPVVKESFDEEGKQRYRTFLQQTYQGNMDLFNERYQLQLQSFSEIQPEQYWYSLIYDSDTLYSEEDVRNRTKRFWVWRDNASFKIHELVLYFQAMQIKLKEKTQNLFLCPDLSQWGYFLNIYSQMQCDGDNPDYSALWDTSMRGLDLYEIAPYVDSCHFITVPVTPDGYPDAYVTSCQHSMMRVMNRGKEMIGGIYWGRYIYNDLFEQLTPEEIIGTMAACGIDGYTSYGMNGLDDGGVLNRMEDAFLDSLKRGNEWCKEVILRRKGERRKEVALLFPTEMSDYEPFEVGDNKIRRLDLLGWYKICCDYGYQTDVISYRQLLEEQLADYKILILPANDCYFAGEHGMEEAIIQNWVKKGGILIHGPKDELVKNSFGIEGTDCDKAPFVYQSVIIPQGSAFQCYQGGKVLAEYVEGKGNCIVSHKVGEGIVYSFGIQMGASYTAKNIPHVPYEQRNKEMYPVKQAKSPLLLDVLRSGGSPASLIAERGIETGLFENGMFVVNHRSTPYRLPAWDGKKYFINRVDENLLLPHSAVWLEQESACIREKLWHL